MKLPGNMCSKALDKRGCRTSHEGDFGCPKHDNGEVKPQRIVVVGAGHVGLYAALRLSKKLSATRAEVVVVDPVVGGKIHTPTSKDEQR